MNGRKMDPVGLLTHLIRKNRLKGLLDPQHILDRLASSEQRLVNMNLRESELLGKLERRDQQNHLLKVERDEVEERTRLKVLREVFLTMLTCLERPMRDYNYQIETLGIEVLNPTVGEDFDSRYHEAVNSSDSNRILRVLRRGYSFKGICLRPSMVELGEAT